MPAVLFPSSILTTINRPLDDKTNAITIAERNAIPLAQRYRGMMLVVQNVGVARPQIFWLPSDNLTNTGWEEIKWDDLSGAGNTREYIHKQDMPSTQWLIQHNFNSPNRALNIFVVDEDGEQIIGQVNTQLSTNNLLIYEFGEPLKGQAYIKL